MNDNNYGMQPDFNNQMNNSNQPKKTGFGLGMLIGFLIAIIIGLSSFIVYDQFIAKEDKEKNPTEQTGNNNEQPIATPTPTPDETLKDFDVSTFNTPKEAINVADRTYLPETNPGMFNDIFTTTINTDKRSVTLTVDWSKYWAAFCSKLGSTACNSMKNKGITSYTISGFSKNIKEVRAEGFGNDWSYESVFFVLEDGTVKYTPLQYELLYKWQEGSEPLNSYLINDVSGIVGLIYAGFSCKSPVMCSGLSMLGVKSDGSFYDLMKLVDFSYYE